MSGSGKWRRFRRLFGTDPRRAVDDEIAFHLEMRTRERIAAGEDVERAREQALQRFGDVVATRAATLEVDERRERHMRRTLFTSELRQDIGYALRSLRRRPGFAVVAILTLALGIGANSAIFSVVYGVLLQSLPFHEPDRLVMVETLYTNHTSFPLSAPDFMSVHDDNRVFTGIAAFSTGVVTMTGRGEPRDVQRTRISKDFFELLGMRTIAGRTFSEPEHVPGATNVVVLTEGFAQRTFGGVHQALNQTVTFMGEPYTVVGVARPGTEIPEQTEAYSPLPYDSSYSSVTDFSRRSEFLNVIGRMRDGVTPARVKQDMSRLGAELEQRFPRTNENITLTSIPLAEKLLGDVRRPLFILLGAVGLVLLVACTNVANLLLARASVREGELAVRAALGAGRGRLIRQLMTESLVLASVGAALGLVLAWWGTRALIAAQPADIPRLNEIGIDGVVVAFTAGLAIMTGLLFGTLPALQATGARMMVSLRESGRGGGGVRGQRVRAALVAAEIAFAVVLLVGAGLLIRSFLQMTRVDTGFTTDNAISFRVALQGSTYDEPAAREQFFGQLETRLRALTGVSHVGFVSGLPMTDNVSLLGPFSIEGLEVPPGVLPEMRVMRVSPTYFPTIGVPQLTGRMFDSRDGPDAPLVVLVNRATIARWFPDGEPVGKRVLLGGTPREVIGVVSDVLQGPPGQPIEPEMYLPYSQSRQRTMRVVVRGSTDLLPLAPRIRAEVHALDAQLPIQSVDPLSRVFANAVARPRLYTTLLTLFAGVALALAIVGIFGVMSYLVTQRAREISIRMALGADRSNVITMVVGSAMKMAAAGLLLGLSGAIGFGRVLRAQLFGVAALDPLTLIVVLSLLGTSAALASFLPARRASRLDPGTALREG